MSLDNERLLDFLREIDGELSRRVVVIAVGGTAMTLLNAKNTTVDIDFTIPSGDYEEFERVKNLVRPKFRVDLFRDGAVFVTILPEDYLAKSKPIKTMLKNIDLRALNPVDIIITKVARLDEQDEQDIESCIAKFKITKDQIEERAKEMGYAGNDMIFINGIEYILKKFFVK